MPNTMSRLCVKNLPEYVVENRLKDFFSQKGEVTDVKLVRTKCGKSRRIAFVGFRTEGEAQAALRYFHNSYMDTSKISCQVALPIGDPNIPTPWSRYSKKKQEELNKEKKDSSGANLFAPLRSKEERKKSKKNIDCSDPKLQEFLQLMQPRSRSKLWANDTVESLLDQKGETRLRETHSWQGGENKACTISLPLSKNPLVRKHGEFDEQGNDSTMTHSARRSHDLSQADLLSDVDYFKSRVKKEWSDSDSSENGNDASNETEDVCEMTVEKQFADRTSEPPEAQAELGDSGMNGPGNLSQAQENENNRLFVRNLPYTATEDDLTALFQRFGNLSEVHLVLDKDTKMSKGYAYVLYTLPESAVRALGELDKSIFQGRILHVMPAEQHNLSKKQMAIAACQSSKSFSEHRVEHRKATEARGDTRAWNSLFMHPDTVVENIARKYGVSKGDILDPEANDLAVRVALGETQVISDTKKALVNSGVNVSALEKIASAKADAISRSNHVILAKNLPYGTSEGDLTKMFGKYGSIDKIILPPTKTLALVVFLEAAECKAAFKGLSYKRYKEAPLYLEMPPSNILSSDSKSERDANYDDVKRAVLEQQQHGDRISDEDIDPDIVESRTLFVNNLNFKTSDEGLRNHFSLNMKEGSIHSAKVKKHMVSGKIMSRGFGFIEFDCVETARNACQSLQATVLDGHALKVDICHTKKNEQALKSSGKVKSTTKLIVKNLAFEATKKDLRQMFSPFGQIKRVRLPRKLINHRGFAFVEFFTKQEAHNALEALSNTHLYNRHLVLEPAKADESLEELQARAAHYVDEQSGIQNRMKLSKKRKHLV